MSEDLAIAADGSAQDELPWWQSRGDLPDLPALVRGLRRRRCRRPARASVARLDAPRRARRRRDLADADQPVADVRLRLRRQRLPRRRPAVRHAGRPSTASRRGAPARHPRHPRLGAEPHLATGTRGSSSRARPGTAQARLVRVARPGAGRRPAQQLGVGVRAARRGRSTRRPASTTCTRSCPSSPTSTGTTPSGRGGDARRRCASGSTAASTASGSTSIHKMAKDPRLRDNEGAPRARDEDWETIHDRLRGIRARASTSTPTG